MIPVLFALYRIMPTFQKILCRSKPYIYHVLLKQFKIFFRPFLIIAHDFGSIDKLVTDKSGNQRNIRIAGKSFVIDTVSIQYVYGHVAIALISRNLP